MTSGGAADRATDCNCGNLADNEFAFQYNNDDDDGTDEETDECSMGGGIGADGEAAITCLYSYSSSSF
jgi:hypothetical protein